MFPIAPGIKGLGFGLAILALSFAASASSQQPPRPSEILSKNDTHAVFAMTKDQWHSQLRRLVEAGLAKPVGSETSGLGRSIELPEGIIFLVVPSYVKSSKKPDFIQVFAGYSQPIAQTFTETVVDNLVRTTRARMAPDYEIDVNVQRTKGGVSFLFRIAEGQPLQ